MEHYVKYLDKKVLIGEDENLYYATFSQLYEAWQNGLLSQVSGGNEPLKFLAPDSGYFFRFPFPDEGIPLAEYCDVQESRGLLLHLEMDGLFVEDDFEDVSCLVRSKTQPGLLKKVSCDNPNRYSEKIDIELTQQQLTSVDGVIRLVPALRCPYTGGVYKIKDQEKLDILIGQIFKHHQQRASFIEGNEFWEDIIKVIKEGYDLIL